MHRPDWTFTRRVATALAPVFETTGAYTAPSLSTSSPSRPWKPTMAQPDGAVKVVQLPLVLPPASVRCALVVKAAEKMRVWPLYWSAHRLVEVSTSPSASVSACSLPPVPPCPSGKPLDSTTSTRSTRLPLRILSWRTAGLAGSRFTSLKLVPCGPPTVSLRRRLSAVLHFHCVETGRWSDSSVPFESTASVRTA